MSKDGHSGNGHKHVTETPDVSHIKNVDVTHETSDVSVSALLKFVGGLTVMTIVVYFLMLGLFKFFNAQAEKEPAPGPMALTKAKEDRLPPEPRLQSAKGFGVKLEDGQQVNLELAAPDAEYQTLRKQWDLQLKCANEKPAAAHGEEAQPATAETKAPMPANCLPIEDAIEKLLKQGLPTRTQGLGEDISMPTAASSGRVTEKVVP